MRIAYVINSMEGGGAALPVPNIVAALAKQGADVRVFALTLRDGRAITALHDAGIEIEVRAGGERDHLAAYRWLRGRLSVWRPQLIWTSLTRATLLGQQVGRSLRVPVVSWQHSMGLKSANRQLLRLNRRRSALWVADSAIVADMMRRRLGIADERLVIWPIFRADPAAPLARPWREGRPVRIGSLGRLHPVKGYHVLIEALRLLSASGASVAPHVVTIAGDGAERDALQRQAAAAGVAIHLSGYTKRPPDFLSALHLYVQPSLHEGFCVAAHEAMQAGLPVIASDVGEIGQSIGRSGGGWLVRPSDAEMLAAALRHALAAPAELAAIGTAARTYVLDRFGPDRFDATAAAILGQLRSRCVIPPR